MADRQYIESRVYLGLAVASLAGCAANGFYKGSLAKAGQTVPLADLGLVGLPLLSAFTAGVASHKTNPFMEAWVPFATAGCAGVLVEAAAYCAGYFL